MTGLPLIFGVMTLAAGMAQAGPTALRVCIPDVPLPPYITTDPKQPGLLERLLAEASAATGVPLKIERQPPVRCRKGVEEGAMDLAPMTPVPANLLIADMPMRSGQINADQRLLSIPVVVVRRRGEVAWQWDGERFLRHQPRVGIKRGILAYGERLAKLGVTVDDAAFSSDQLLRKLSAGRIDVALMSRGDFEQMQAELPRELEALPQLFAQFDLYLGMSRRLDSAQRAQAQLLVQELARRRPR